MRKDVKLGFAIGGVLLAVAIVFALVNSGTPPQPEIADNATEQIASAPDASRSETATTTVPRAELARSGDAGIGTSTPPTETPRSADATASTTSTPSTATPERRTDAFGGGATNTGAFDWTQALNTGDGTPRNRTPMVAAIQQTPRESVRVETPGRVESPGRVETPATTRVDTRPLTLVTEPAPSHAATGDADDAIKAAGTMIADPARTSLTSPTRAARTHTVKSGDTFSTLSATYYGHTRYHAVISKANPGVDSSHLQIGQVLQIPAYEPKAATARTAAAPAPERTIDAARQYRVQAGDTLHRISIKLYGSPKNSDALYDLNKTTIGSNPNKLKLGMVLQLPAAPTATQR